MKTDTFVSMKHVRYPNADELREIKILQSAPKIQQKTKKNKGKRTNTRIKKPNSSTKNKKTKLKSAKDRNRSIGQLTKLKGKFLGKLASVPGKWWKNMPEADKQLQYKAKVVDVKCNARMEQGFEFSLFCFSDGVIYPMKWSDLQKYWDIDENGSKCPVLSPKQANQSTIPYEKKDSLREEKIPAKRSKKQDGVHKPLQKQRIISPSQSIIEISNNAGTIQSKQMETDWFGDCNLQEPGKGKHSANKVVLSKLPSASIACNPKAKSKLVEPPRLSVGMRIKCRSVSAKSKPIDQVRSQIMKHDFRKQAYIAFENMIYDCNHI